MSLCLTEYYAMNTILYVTKHHTMKTYELHAFLTSALDGVVRFTPQPL